MQNIFSVEDKIGGASPKTLSTRCLRKWLNPRRLRSTEKVFSAIEIIFLVTNMFDAVAELILAVTNRVLFPAEKTLQAIEKDMVAASKTISRRQKVGRGADRLRNLAVEELADEFFAGWTIHPLHDKVLST